MPALERTTTRASHTPGPWHLSRYGNFIRHIQGDQTAPNICAVDVFGGPDGEREANARLIAAAPDLLAALKGAVDTIRTWHDMQEPADQAGPAWDIYRQHAPEMQRIHAAMAKAEGR